MIRKTILATIFLILGMSVKAQNVEFLIEGPRVAIVGSYFKVTFVVNEDPSNFEGPDFGELEVVAGPVQSEMSSYSYSNGKSSSSKKITYTYGLVAHKEGTYTINPAKVVVDGKVYHTKAYPIEIAKERTTRAEEQAADGNESKQGNSTQSSRISKDDILIRMFADKSSLYKGEPLVVTLKLYDRTESIVGVRSSKIPDFNGFWKQELPLEQQQQAERETFNGKVYNTQIIGRYLLFPQKAGKLTIEKMEMTLITRIVLEQQQSSRSMFDDFFGGGVSTQDIERVVSSQPTTINVKELPAGAPAEFDGAVGEFAIDCKIDASKINANSGGTLSLQITGAGNMPLINAPKVDLPTTFEVYPAKTEDKLDVTVSGVKGYKKFDYPFIARAEGDYDIGSISFAYFDPRTESYKVISTSSYKLEVLRDISGSSANANSAVVSGVTKEDLKILNKDIEFIRTGAAKLSKANSFIVTSPLYLLAIIVMVIIFTGILLYLRKRIKEMSDSVKVKNKRANKIAVKRLKTAGGYMNAGKESLFYQEMLIALFGYTGDKLNIPVAKLSKDNISEQLKEKGVAESDINELLKVIADCEMAQYSPMESSQMKTTYTEAVELIGRIENKI